MPRSPSRRTSAASRGAAQRLRRLSPFSRTKRGRGSRPATRGSGTRSPRPRRTPSFSRPRLIDAHLVQLLHEEGLHGVAVAIGRGIAAGFVGDDQLVTACWSAPPGGTCPPRPKWRTSAPAPAKTTRYTGSPADAILASRWPGSMPRRSRMRIDSSISLSTSTSLARRSPSIRVRSPSPRRAASPCTAAASCRPGRAASTPCPFRPQSARSGRVSSAPP